MPAARGHSRPSRAVSSSARYHARRGEGHLHRDATACGSQGCFGGAAEPERVSRKLGFLKSNLLALYKLDQGRIGGEFPKAPRRDDQTTRRGPGRLYPLHGRVVDPRVRNVRRQSRLGRQYVRRRPYRCRWRVGATQADHL